MTPERPDRGNITRLPEEHDRQLSVLYRQTMPGDPPPALDQEILGAARQAAEAAARDRKRKPVRRRRVPLPLATVVLVSMILAPLLVWNAYLRERPGAAVTPETQATAPGSGPVLQDSATSPSPGEVLPAPRQEMPSDPEDPRLVEIRALLAEGKDALAWERVGDLRRHFPDVRIPDDLLDELAAARARLLEQAVAE